MPNVIRARVTKSAVDRLPPDGTIRDSELPGFGVRRQRGDPVYFLQKRVNGKVRWVTIGRHGAPWTPEMARREALRLMGRIAIGDKLVQTQKEKLDNPTLAEAVSHFTADHGPTLKPATREKYRILFTLHIVPALGTLPVADIKRADILRFHSRLAGKPSTANYAVAMVSKLMSWCEERGFRPENSNPCRAIKKFRETKRQRYLTSEEFARLGEVLDAFGSRNDESLFAVAAIRLLLLTGARVSEILTLQWTFVDFERRLLTLPDSKTGPKFIRLNEPAAEVLRSLPRVHGNPFVIIGRRTGARLINLQKPWRRIRAAADLPDVRMHDLRHSFASVAAASRGSLPMIGKLLGHNHPLTTARYAHLADDPVQSLNQTVGEAIAGALGKRVRT